MPKPITLLFLYLSILGGSCDAQPQPGHFEPIAVVELFTSEGCSSCPPADKILTALTAASAKDKRKIFTLSFHVDYWDRLGWRDPFSSSSFSDRQHQYAEALHLNGVYTPQMVVNGITEFVGSDEAKLNEALAKTLKKSSPAAFSELSISSEDKQRLVLHYGLSGDHTDCVIHFALVSRQESTAVKRGENSGRQLGHTNVVREFITMPAGANGEAVMDISSYSDKGNLFVVAFVQRKQDLHIITAAGLKP